MSFLSFLFLVIPWFSLEVSTLSLSLTMVLSVFLFLPLMNSLEGSFISESVLFSSASLSLTILTMALTLICLVAIFSMAANSQTFLAVFLTMLGFISADFFLCSSLIPFYILFELSLVPIFLIVLGWGYQTERLSASKALFFYTFSSSLPLLILMLSWNLSGIQFMFQTSLAGSVGSSSSGWFELFSFFLMVGFLVKLPLYTFHAWLLKAHVEAPVVGSMFLAAILLKLGGWGVIQFGLLMGASKSLDGFFVLSVLSLLTVPLLCAQTLDMKVLIAASSVAHMAVGYMVFFYSSNFLVMVFLWVLISHGFSSSLMFYLSYVFYKSTNSRSLLFTKSIKVSSVILWSLWFFSCTSMMGGPPSLNLWIEIMGFGSIMLFTPALGSVLLLCAFTTGAYSMLLFSQSNMKSVLLPAFTLVRFTALDKSISLSHSIFILFSVAALNMIF